MAGDIRHRIYITGASGSGTTTLGRALAAEFGWQHFDTDDYFWLPTDPPFQARRPGPEMRALLERDLTASCNGVLSGMVGAWGEVFDTLFDLVVFLLVPTATRLARLTERERQRFGEAALAPGGSMHTIHTEFMAWAAAYDDGGLEMRSRRRHEAWLATLPCPVLRLAGEESVEERIAAVGRTLQLLDDRTK
jgi:adenylate kinase family enzyme